MFDSVSTAFSSFFDRVSGRASLRTKEYDAAFVLVRNALLDADVPYATVTSFMAELRHEIGALREKPGASIKDQIVAHVYKKLVALIASASAHKMTLQGGRIMLVGLQGSGKTTTVSKLVQYAIQKKIKPERICVGSVDFTRPAAHEQLKIGVGRLGADFVSIASADPRKAASEILTVYRSGSYDLLIVDTAGRLHVDAQLLQELTDIKAIIKPTSTLLVMDGMAGQQSLAIATQFAQAVQLDGGILTKMEGDARAGIACAFASTVGKALLFVGVGELATDLQEFIPERIAKRMLGLGDVDTLAERIDSIMQRDEQERLSKLFISGGITIADFAAVFKMMSKLGPLKAVLGYLPGASGLSINGDQAAAAEHEMKRCLAMVDSMTPRERRASDKTIHSIFSVSVKRRIARGAGVSEAEVTKFINRFEEMARFVKLFKKTGMMPR